MSWTAHLNILVHDMINLLYYEYWTDKQKYLYEQSDIDILKRIGTRLKHCSAPTRILLTINLLDRYVTTILVIMFWNFTVF